MVPTFTQHRSTRSAASSTPAASPCLRRSLSAWPPHRRIHSASELTHMRKHTGHALHPGPYPPDLSRHSSYGASATGSLTFRLLILLAGPGPSGDTKPSRRCRGCSHPPRRSPAQAAPSFTTPLRRRGREVFHLPRCHAPRGARTHRSTGGNPPRKPAPAPVSGRLGLPGHGWSRSPGSGPCRPPWESLAAGPAGAGRCGPSDQPAALPETPRPRARSHATSKNAGSATRLNRSSNLR